MNINIKGVGEHNEADRRGFSLSLAPVGVADFQSLYSDFGGAMIIIPSWVGEK